MKEDSNKLSQFFDRYSVYIGCILLVLVIAESVYLLWRDNRFTPDIERRLTVLEGKISEQAKNNVTVGGSTETKIEVGNLINASQESGKVAGEKTPQKASQKTESTPEQTGKININIASASELDQLPGIGQSYASRIIEYRSKNGPFKTPEDIKNVKGIGDATFNKLKDKISI